MRCAPELSVLIDSEAPLPSAPSRSEVQLTVRLGSSRSDALAAKATVAPCSYEAWMAGAEMEMVGVELITTVIDVLADLPPESVTEAVMLCVPERRVPTGSDASVPRAPSRFEVRLMVRLASSRSEAVAVKLTIAPCS